MKRILVPTDFSQNSVHGIEFAMGLASSVTAEVILLNVFQVPVAATDVPFIDISLEELDKEYTNRLRQLAAETQARTGFKGLVSIRTKSGPVAECICELMDEEDTDLVVMGMRHDILLTDRLFGSTPSAMLRKSVKPLLLIPEGTAYEIPKTIGVACDMHHLNDREKLKLTREIAAAFNARLLIFSIINEKDEFRPVKALNNDVMETVLNDYPHQVFFPNYENVKEGIRDFTEEHACDWLVMFPHDHSLPERIFGTTHSKGIAIRANIPVLIINERATGHA